MTTNTFKIVVIGQGKTGKTALLQREIKNEYIEKYSPTNAVTRQHKTYSDGNAYDTTVNYVDLNGADLYDSLHLLHYKDAQAVIICVDSTQAINDAYLINKIGALQAIEPQPLITLVRTKTDLPAKITTEKLKEFAAQYDNIDVAETSAENGAGVNGLFQGIITKLMPVATKSPIAEELSLSEKIENYPETTSDEIAFKQALRELNKMLNEKPLKDTDAAKQTIKATNQLLISLETTDNLSNDQVKDIFKTYLNECPHTKNEPSLLVKLIKAVAITGICALVGAGLAAGICVSLGLGVGVGAAIAGSAGLFISSATFFGKNAPEKAIQKVADTGKVVYGDNSKSNDSKDDLAPDALLVNKV